MQIAVISPVSQLRFCEYGDIHMSLAHIVLENDTYADYYLNAARNKFVILDNSAFELESKGIGVPFDMVFDAARRTNPHEVIATDTLFKGSETVESTQAFIDAIPSDLKGKFRIMAVPQGRTIEEWCKCLYELLKIPEVNTIGLSKLSVPACWMGSHRESGVVARARVACMETLDEGEWRKGLENRAIHLLGSDDWGAWELQSHKRYADTPLAIRSCDSSVTVWYGAHGQRFDHNTGKMSEYIVEKPDLESANERTAEIIDECRDHILHNIAVLHQFSK